MFTSVCYMVCGFFFFFFDLIMRHVGSQFSDEIKDQTQRPMQGERRILAMGSHQSSEVAQSCPTLCNPMDCSLPVSSTHGIFQARVLEWLPVPRKSLIMQFLLKLCNLIFPQNFILKGYCCKPCVTQGVVISGVENFNLGSKMRLEYLELLVQQSFIKV